MRYLLLMLLIFSFRFGHAQSGEKEIAPLKYDSTSQVNVRSFNKEALEDYRNDSDFNYVTVKEPETLSLWDRFWLWVFEMYRDIYGNPTKKLTFQVVLYTICGFVLLYVIMRLAGVNARKVFYGKKEGKTIKAQILDEDINKIDFDERIATSVGSENYQEAIRLHYLKCLKDLSDQGLIDWKINKTNHEYEVELKDARIRKPFGRITYLYENICYGDFPISLADYEKFSPEFNVFDTEIKA